MIPDAFYSNGLAVENLLDEQFVDWWKDAIACFRLEMNTSSIPIYTYNVVLLQCGHSVKNASVYYKYVSVRIYTL